MSKYKPFTSLTVDALIWRYNEEGGFIEILLVKRKNEPFKDMFAFPGGYVDEGEEPFFAIKREVREETNLKVDYFTPYKWLSGPNRDPRGYTTSLVFKVEYKEYMGQIKAGDDASEAKWVKLLDSRGLAFDHDSLITDLIIDTMDVTFENFKELIK